MIEAFASRSLLEILISGAVCGAWWADATYSIFAAFLSP